MSAVDWSGGQWDAVAVDVLEDGVAGALCRETVGFADGCG